MIKGYDFSDVKFNLANNRRHGIKNNIHVANVIDGRKVFKMHRGEFLADEYYYLHKIDELDFWQEISGFFHSRSKVYVQEGADFAVEIIPDDIEIHYGMSVAAGDYVVDKDLNVYRIYGWDNQNDSDYYWDFLDGSGSYPLTTIDGRITNNWVSIEAEKRKA